MVLIQESILENIDDSKILSFWGQSNYQWVFLASKGRSGGLLVVWDKGGFKSIESFCYDRFIIVRGKWAKWNFECIICNVYSPCEMGERVYYRMNYWN